MFSNDLVEAYKGYYEEEITLDRLEKLGADVSEEYKAWFETLWAEKKIVSHGPEQRLIIYCEWNGIIGYATRLFEIATGEI